VCSSDLINSGVIRTRSARSARCNNKDQVNTDVIGAGFQLFPAVSGQVLSNNNVQFSSVDNCSSVNAVLSVGESQSERHKQWGTCSICFRKLSLTSANVMHSHGLNGQCAGSGFAPVDGSVTTRLSSDLVVEPLAPGSAITGAVISSESETQALLDSVVELQSPVLKFIPKASRVLAAEKLSTLLDRVVALPDNIDAWRNLLQFSYICFGVSVRGGKRHRSSLATKVNKLLAEYSSGFHHQSSSQPTQSSKQHRRPRRLTTAHVDVQQLAARVSAKIEEGDVRGAIKLAASNDTLASCDDTTVEILRQLHPSRAISTTFNQPQLNAINQTLKFTEKDIVDAIKTFPAGSAGGLDGIRPQHLKDMTNHSTGIAGQRLIASLTEFSNLCVEGRVPCAVRPVLFGVSLCALTKKGGGIRPIAVSSTFRRLIAKAAVRSVKEDVVTKLAPMQLGFGIQQGAEAAIHTARSFLINLTEKQALLKIDF